MKVLEGSLNRTVRREMKFLTTLARFSVLGCSLPTGINSPSGIEDPSTAGGNSDSLYPPVVGLPTCRFAKNGSAFGRGCRFRPRRFIEASG
jgi:hypothetical protein